MFGKLEINLYGLVFSFLKFQKFLNYSSDLLVHIMKISFMNHLERMDLSLFVQMIEVKFFKF